MSFMWGKLVADSISEEAQRRAETKAHCAYVREMQEMRRKAELNGWRGGSDPRALVDATTLVIVDAAHDAWTKAQRRCAT